MVLVSTVFNMAYGPDTEELLRRLENCDVELDVSTLNLTSLPSLPSKVKFLNCRRTPLTSLPELPPNLCALNCRKTNLTRLPSLPSTVYILNCSDTQITELPPLPKSLIFLDCANTKIQLLPYAPCLQILNVDDTPLLCPRKAYEPISWYMARYIVWLKEEYEPKIRAKERSETVKEELVAKAWHPSRVERWLEQGVCVEAL